MCVFFWSFLMLVDSSNDAETEGELMKCDGPPWQLWQFFELSHCMFSSLGMQVCSSIIIKKTYMLCNLAFYRIWLRSSGGLIFIAFFTDGYMTTVYNQQSEGPVEDKPQRKPLDDSERLWIAPPVNPRTWWRQRFSASGRKKGHTTSGRFLVIYERQLEKGEFKAALMYMLMWQMRLHGMEGVARCRIIVISAAPLHPSAPPRVLASLSSLCWFSGSTYNVMVFYSPSPLLQWCA